VKRTIFAAILSALLSVWGVGERILGDIAGRLARVAFGAIDRDFVHAEASRARREMWS
jgi:hypothetical protein